ncbi:unnamed protein product (macronuclear) [Paramecium tetraurelia]|uniref:Uncharacterized protein n=1 Tax=Paramecium tetraurelia TaxID=5888 RepID=A0BBZ9_PARTE|nr:uncharacterized protein GSPATT00000502001 [Paramecium tetraurelia]CAK56066.1 unnamed protein product [Paramecium tetraurelia]|eukprot:XP_001423464.1 hypothetical protein (macronuclear) [Paramecium tetraurelia strain d4-2]
MYKKPSLLNLTPISILKTKNQAKNQSFCPSTFLNEIDSFPQQSYGDFNNTKVFEPQIPLELVVPKTVRRRHAIGDQIFPQQSDQVLPNLPSLSKNTSMCKSSLEDLFLIQEAQTQRQSTELALINRKIKSILNSNKRQVTFQPSHVIIDKYDNSQIVQDLPTIGKYIPKRRIHIKHITTEI